MVLRPHSRWMRVRPAFRLLKLYTHGYDSFTKQGSLPTNNVDAGWFNITYSVLQESGGNVFTGYDNSFFLYRIRERDAKNITRNILHRNRSHPIHHPMMRILIALLTGVISFAFFCIMESVRIPRDYCLLLTGFFAGSLNSYLIQENETPWPPAHPAYANCLHGIGTI